jgi:hypothetical protein
MLINKKETEKLVEEESKDITAPEWEEKRKWVEERRRGIRERKRGTLVFICKWKRIIRRRRWRKPACLL